ncbi:putative undecaprenyl-phosphate N-acetylglucosaminyl 1-phosphate transferase [mine drainage metagenome]|uniref:Putative undecaprenyl-phosphate N-acetylglucosaminyl 1-phosphate transferase n=1 Tax=mine drainage metagenome TaxID=410659 RepID=A0A1J5S9T8_9ZZZZ
MPALATVLAVFLLSVGMVRWVLGWLRRKQILDLPNERSSHSLPTPRGGGLAVTPVCLVAWLVLAAVGLALPGTPWVVAGAAALLGLSWADDRFSLPAAPRFAVHFLACALGLAALPHQALILQGLLPWWADRLVALLGYVWFVNLTNFMDGIDGITGAEAASVAAGLALLAWLDGRPQAVLPSLALLAAALGFLVWNWHPAKLFLGDSGSVPLGYLLGWLLLDLAGHGHLAAGLILPLYYLADATLTLLRRAARGEKLWQAHRQHFYQRAVRGGVSHSGVVLRILAVNMLLIALAVAAGRWPLAALAAAGLAMAGLLAHLARLGRGAA